MSTPAFSNQPGSLEGFSLKYPQPVAAFNSYDEAQAAVDHLADEKFPVENLLIVGTDLRQYERVLGSRTWGNVLVNGALVGLTQGLFVALVLFLLVPGLNVLTALLYGLGLGVLFGMLMAAITHAMSRGRRDFNSMTRTFATRYELLAEHKVAQQARDLLGATQSARVQAVSGNGWQVDQTGAAPPQPDAQQPPMWEQQPPRQG